MRYVGITHYVDSAHDALADIVQAEKPDFVQVNYSIVSRSAERRLLPLCRDRGVAVLVNRAFEDGRLFGQVKGRAVPEWAGEIGCSSWAQIFLKFVLADPAVTVVIPATSNRATWRTTWPPAAASCPMPGSASASRRCWPEGRASMFARAAPGRLIGRAVDARAGELPAVLAGFGLFFCLFAGYFMLRPTARPWASPRV